MDYLFSKWGALRDQLRDKHLFFLLDYDGTLTPIVEHPQKAIIPSETKELLQKLLKSSLCHLAIISGRALRDIKKILGLKEIIYVGNHGLEIEGPKIKFSRLPFDIRRDPAIAGESCISPRLLSIIREINRELNRWLFTVKGVYVEDKDITLSVHYRQANQSDYPLIKRTVNRIVQPYLVRGKVKLNYGKKVIEIKPPVQWNKGRIAEWLIARLQFVLGETPFVPIYIGDDIADEEAFNRLKNKGLTIFVGTLRQSQAKYYLKDTQEVYKFLKIILEMQKKIKIYARIKQTQRAI